MIPHAVLIAIGVVGAGLVPARGARTPTTAAAPVTGQVTEKIVCRETPAQSYALYLPSAYTPSRPWPVLYLLDARANALVPIERFRAAAEEFGWILVSSWNSQSDTQDDPNTPAMQAMWKDTHATLALDGRRTYAGGFSGGGRAAVAMAFALPKGVFAGVIGCGAGFPDASAPVREPPAFGFFGTVGDRDMNYYEMRSLDEKLAAVKAPHRIAYFDGPHQWAPVPVARDAVVWMELEAMKTGTRPRDPERIAKLYTEARSAAGAAETSGHAAEAETAAKRLAESPEVKQAVKEARSRDERDRAKLSRLAGIVRHAAEQSEAPAAGLVAAQLGIPALRKTAASDPSPEERLSAERILANLRAQTGFYLPQQMLEKRELARARMLYSVAGEIDPDNPNVDYNLAAAAARFGDASQACKDLDRAVARGFRRFELLEKDSDFDPIRATPAFRAWMERAASSVSSAPAP
jgi:predicted esterase